MTKTQYKIKIVCTKWRQKADKGETKQRHEADNVTPKKGGDNINELSVRTDAGIMQRQQFTQELFTRFINYVDASPKTIETYARALNQFMKWIVKKDIRQPVRADVIQYRDELKVDHKPATVQNYIIAVRQFFRWTAQEGLYPNIAENVKGAKMDRKHKKDALTTNQVRKIIKTQAQKEDLKGKRDYAILSAAVTGGLRTIEIQRANVEDLRNLGDHTVLYIQGKGHDERSDYIMITDQVETVIRDYLKARGKTKKKDPLFASTSNRNHGGRMTTRSISRIIKESFIEAGYDSDRLTAHSLRHTAGTLNLMNGGSLQETQQLLRHQDINTTLIYVHNLERASNQSEERISSAIFSPDPEDQEK